jgi:hypothetical protein
VEFQHISIVHKTVCIFFVLFAFWILAFSSIEL